MATETLGASLAASEVRAGVQNLFGVEPAQRVIVHRNTVRRRDVEGGNGVGKTRSGRGVQSANLNTAAPGNLDDAVAVLPRRRAQGCQGFKRHGADRQQPNQQSIAGLHRHR